MVASDSARHALQVMCFFCLTACGYSQQEWDQKLRDGQQLTAQVSDQQRLVAACKNDKQSAHSELKALRDEMVKQGLNPDTLSHDLGQQRVASEEYQLRLGQLGQLQEEFSRLNRALLPLTDRGITSLIRNNRILVRLPGHLLFANNSDKVSSTGAKTLAEIARVLRSEPRFGHRAFQVTGHVDSRFEAGKGFSDPWHLSALQARAVLVSVSKALKAQGGAFSQRGWSAAGYGDNDPISTDDSAASRTLNHRIEIVLSSRTEEMLNLGGLSALP